MGSCQTRKHSGNFVVPKRFCLMSLSNPKQTSKKHITPWLEEVQYLTLNLTPKQCTTFNGKNPCTSPLNSQVIPTYILINLASLNTFIFDHQVPSITFISFDFFPSHNMTLPMFFTDRTSTCWVFQLRNLPFF